MGLRHWVFSQDLLVTPHIDRVLQQRVKGGRSREETAKVEEGGPSTSSVTCSERGGYESRLMQLERQLSQLLQRNKVSSAFVREGRSSLDIPLLTSTQTARKRASGTRQPHPLGQSISHDISCDAYWTDGIEHYSCFCMLASSGLQ